MGEYYRGIKGDTRSLDYSSYSFRSFAQIEWKVAASPVHSPRGARAVLHRPSLASEKLRQRAKSTCGCR